MTPNDWAQKFESAHGFAPLFTLDEIEEPWCDVCSDFHYSDESHSTVE